MGLGGDFRAIFLRKMHQNQLENPLLLSGFSGFRSFLKRIFQVFIVFLDGVRGYSEDFNGFQSILDWAKPGQGSFSFAFY